VLPAVLTAVREGTPSVVVPHACAVEARLVPGAVVFPVTTLADVVALHRGEDYPDPPPARSGPPVAAAVAACAGDLSEVYGQAVARRALEIAAAGGHHLLMLGPPGAGKTMLASRLPGLLPPLDEQQALEVTAVHSLAGTLDPAAGLVRWPPFESPHHTSTPAAIAGGGQGLPRPGAASRAHRGVLFLDEAAEFDPRALQALRQPLEDGVLVIHRARGTARFPARFQLVLASNPCPCGLAVGRGIECLCTPTSRRRYLARLSGPLLDRVDLQVEVLGVTRSDLHEPVPPESTAAQERLSGLTWTCNGQLPGSVLRGRFRLSGRVTRALDQALDQGRLTLRGVDRVLRVAWTVADLQGRASPDASDVALALGLRRIGPAPGMIARRRR
jgi:magnesium chelatase family protein